MLTGSGGPAGPNVREARRTEMKTALRALVIGAAVLGGSVVPANAHHSTAMFDSTKLVLLRGTVRSFSYMNPHSWISVDGAVEGKDEAARWDVEATSPTTLARIGVTQSTLKPGDKVTMGIRPLRDGRRAGAFVFVVTADGKHYGADPGQLGLKVGELKPS